MSAWITIKRSELYNKVWEQPMLHLAKQYGLSDRGLAKICEKHDIPCPSRGHWAKKQHGRKSPRIPLPQRDDDTDVPLPDPASVIPLIPANPTEFDHHLEREMEDDTPIVVPETLRGAHHLVGKARDQLQGAETDERKIIVPPEEVSLDIRTSKASLRRSLLLMSALLKALDERGYEIGPGPRVVINDATVYFGITEGVKDLVEHVDEVDLEDRYEFGHSRTTKRKVPSERLTLHIHSDHTYWNSGQRHTWRDTAKSKLEGKLKSFVTGLIQYAAAVKARDEYEQEQAELRRQAEIDRQQEAAELAEKRKQYKTEKARLTTLVGQAADWHKSKQIRELVEAVRETHSRNAPIDPGSEIAGWIEWASQQADRFDPLCPSPPSILDEDLEEPQAPSYGGRRW